ncbi:unnamed protein product [Spodoptera littoralis]|uniref:Uncharacterized protein n=1 Tax=Spodoptera littoralis TaxID=7109 RepID=A0A9P0IJ27_SPOLI|nr:unnamed protein product [Spodoptera littoralis]CAH1647810.1 unnamed protein product [Spodoptera littoralis]
MHALSKKHFYDVMKGSQEDTILEYNSDDENENYDVDIEAKSTSDVGCFTRCHTKSYGVQTQWSRNNKNFRNEYTNTSDVLSESTLPNSDTSRYIAIHRSLSCEDIAVSRIRSAQTSGPITYSTTYSKNDVCVEAVTGVQLQKRGFLKSAADNPSKFTITDDLYQWSDKSIEHQCCTMEAGHQTEQTCFCHELVDLPCQRGVTACHAFTLGTTETRRIQNENSKSKLIGGFRVPVCKGHKRF